MANLATLTGCASRESAVHDELARLQRRSDANGTAPPGEVLRSPKNRIPLLWLAAFSEVDRLPIQPPQGPGYVTLCAPMTEAVARLRRRRDAVLDLFGERFAGLYDGWIAILEESFPDALLLGTEEIFWFGPLPAMSAWLDGALRALAPADEGGAIADLAALEDFVPVRDVLATRDLEEQHFLLAGSAPARSRTAAHWPSVKSDDTVAWIARLAPDAVGQAAQDALDDVVPDALWASGDWEAAYLCARCCATYQRPATARALGLARYASLDPEPRSARVRRAIEEALRLAFPTDGPSDRGLQLAVLALLPLEEPKLARLARRLAAPRAAPDSPLALAWALRAGEDRAVERFHAAEFWLADQDRAVLLALAAERLAAAGQRDEAERTLEEAFRHCATAFRSSPAAVLIGLRLWLRYDLFAAPAAEERATGRAPFAVAWEACRTSGPSALGRCAERFRARNGAELLGWMDEFLLGGELPPWAPEAEAHWGEGLIDDQELRLLRTCAEQSHRTQALRAFVGVALVQADTAGRALADAMVARLGGRDQGRVASLETALREALDAVVAWAAARRTLGADAPRPTRADRLRLQHLEVAARTLADVGGANEVAVALRAAEERAGPVSEWWPRDAGSESRRGLGVLQRLLCAAAGRAREADALVPRAASLEGAWVAGALARDGDHDSALARAREILAAQCAPEAIGALVWVVAVVAPNCIAGLRAAIIAAAAQGPANKAAALVGLTSPVCG